MKIKLLSENKKIDIKVTDKIETPLEITKNDGNDKIEIQIPKNLQNNIFLILGKNEEFDINNLFQTILLEKKRKKTLMAFNGRKKEIEKNLKIDKFTLNKLKKIKGKIKRKTTQLHSKKKKPLQKYPFEIFWSIFKKNKIGIHTLERR